MLLSPCSFSFFQGVPPYPALDTPEGVEAAAISLHTAELSWKEVERATAYEVSVIEARYAKAAGAAEAAEVAENAGDTGANGTACQIIETDEAAASIQGLKAGTEYQVTVTAIYEVDEDDKEDVCSEPSEPVTFVTETPQIGQVASVEAKAGGTSSVILSWQQYQEENTNVDGSAPAVSYIVYYSDKESGSYEAVAEGITETSYTHTGLAAKTTGYYKVTAVVTMDEKKILKARCQRHRSAQQLRLQHTMVGRPGPGQQGLVLGEREALAAGQDNPRIQGFPAPKSRRRPGLWRSR